MARGCAGALQFLTGGGGEGEKDMERVTEIKREGERVHTWARGVARGENRGLMALFRETLGDLCSCRVALGEKEMVRLWEILRQYSVHAVC